MIGVVMVEDDRLVAAGIAALIAAHDIEVMGVAHDLPTGVDLVVGRRPRVILCDVMLDGRPTGLDCPAAIAGTVARGTPVILLSSYAAEYFVASAEAAGAAGYLTKDTDADTLVAAIRIVADGGRVLSVPVPTHRAPSVREIEVIRLVADGMSSDEIGLRLGMGSRTVESHLARLFARYEVPSRTELAMLAARSGWITVLPGRPAASRS